MTDRPSSESPRSNEDAAVRAYVRSRAVDAPPEFVEQVLRRVEEVEMESPWWRRPRRWAVAGVAVATVGAAMVLMAVLWNAGLLQRQTGQTAGPVVTRSPAALASETPAPSPETTPSVTPQPTASPTPVPPPGWSTVTIPGANVNDIAEAGGRIVAVGTTGSDASRAAAWTSDDGSTWTPASTLGGIELKRSGLAFVTGTPTGFVAMGSTFEEGDPISTPFILFSSDGTSWEAVPTPAECSFAHQLVSGDFGVVATAGRCRSEGDFDASPARVLYSSNGRDWTTIVDQPGFADLAIGPVATDGRRLAALDPVNAVSDDPDPVWISDDGQSWRMIENPFPENLSPNSIGYGNGRFLVLGSQLIREGDPDPAACVSPDAETWRCEVLPDDVPALATLVGTPTGVVGVWGRPVDLAGTSSESVVALSPDGLAWTVRTIEPGDRYFNGATYTSHGVFANGGTVATQEQPSEPFVLVHRAPLP